MDVPNSVYLSDKTPQSIEEIVMKLMIYSIALWDFKRTGSITSSNKNAEKYYMLKTEQFRISE